jgi:hypothetical protein
MSKTCLIRQPAGLGDIFFLQKIAKHYLSKGYKILWPVISEFKYVKDYIKVEGITFVDENESFPYKNIYMRWDSTPTQISDSLLYLPIQNFDRNYPNKSVMYSKYNLLGMKYHDWVDFFEFERNLEKEEKLKNILNIKDSEYNLVNRQFGSPPNSQNCGHMGQYENSVEMTYIEGYSIFDWVGIILGAKHIYTAETSLLYILTKLGIENVTVYSKHNPPNYFHVSELFPKNWTYIL